MTDRTLGLAHLSLIELTPPQLVEVAAGAGFDVVGVRARAVTAAESPFDLSIGSQLLQQTVERCADLGVSVQDVEFILLNGAVTQDDWLPMLDTAAALGAQSVTVAVDDPDRDRALDAITGVVADARDRSLTVTLEPISYNSLHSLPEAFDLAQHADCLILLDALHLLRFGATTDQVRRVAGRVGLVQVCDAPAQRPADKAALVAESRVERLAPGLGDADVTGLLHAVAPEVVVSVECPSAIGRRTRSAQQWAQYLYDTTVSAIKEAEEGHDD